MPVSSQRQMELQRQRVARGLCYKCPNPHEEGTRWCTDHRLYHREYMERYKERKRQQAQATTAQKVCRVCLAKKPHKPWNICKPCHAQSIRDGLKARAAS